MERDKKKRGLQGGTQPPDSRTRLWKASADGAETSFCVSAFQSFMVLGKNELRSYPLYGVGN